MDRNTPNLPLINIKTSDFEVIKSTWAAIDQSITLIRAMTIGCIHILGDHSISLIAEEDRMTILSRRITSYENRLLAN